MLPFFYTQHTDHDPRYMVHWGSSVVLCPWVAERSEAIPIMIAMVIAMSSLAAAIMSQGYWSKVLGSWSGERREGYPPPFSWSRDFCAWSVSPPFPSSLLYRNCCSLYSNRKTILILYVRYTTYHPPSTLLPPHSQ